eukprot:1462128-Prymnesium_polylepis.1
MDGALRGGVPDRSALGWTRVLQKGKCITAVRTFSLPPWHDMPPENSLREHHVTRYRSPRIDTYLVPATAPQGA